MVFQPVHLGLISAESHWSYQEMSLVVLQNIIFLLRLNFAILEH